MKWVLAIVSSLLCAHAAAAQPNPIPNSSFEVWHYDTFWGGLLPDGWNGFTDNGLITQSTDAHSGQFALAGAVATLLDSIEFPYVFYALSDANEGFPINFQPVAFSGWYKLTSIGRDQLVINLRFKKNGGLIGTCHFCDSITTNTYKHFSVSPELLFQVPDTVEIYVLMQNSVGKVHLGSNFVLDDISLVGSSSVKNASPLSFAIEENYPDPFSARTNIRYSLNTDGRVRLEVLDVTGRSVALLADDNESEGEQEVTFDADRLPAGPYLCRLTSSNGGSSIRILQIAH